MAVTEVKKEPTEYEPEYETTLNTLNKIPNKVSVSICAKLTLLWFQQFAGYKM